MSFPITTRFPDEADIVCLAANLRLSDRQELAAVCDLSPEAAVRESVRLSDPAFLRAAFAGDELLCIAGATPASPNGLTAAPWLLATALLDRYSLALTREARAGVAAMLGKYPLLSNVIDARQTRTVGWLGLLGFKLCGRVEIKPGYPLWRFEMRRGE